MASIIQRPKKDGTTTWQVMIRLKDQKPIVKTFKSESEAQTFVQMAEPRIIEAINKSKKRQSSAVPVIPTYSEFLMMPIKTVLKEFMANEGGTERNKSIAPAIFECLDDATVAEFRKPWYKAYIARARKRFTKRKAPPAWACIKAQIHVIHSAITWKSDCLDVPCPEFVFSTNMFPKGWSVSRERRLERSEELKILEYFRRWNRSSRHKYRLLFKLALETAARLQELVRAEWSEVSIERRLWIIPESHTKSKKTRAVPLSKAAIRAFKLLKLMCKPGETRVFPRLGKPRSVSTRFHLIMEELGIEDLRFHDLRHEAISRMVLYKRKLSVYEIMTIVGHSSLQMLNRYANLRGDELADRMD